ncbi:MAG: TonB-dependent receptor [Acidobacteriota bacterium]
MRKAIFVFMFAALIAGAAYAQETTGQIRGTIVDPDGAALPGVTITVENDMTGMDRTSITDGSGAFRFAALQPGDYTMTATLDGFQTHKSAMRVVLGGTHFVELDMALGAITDVIEVTGEAPLVDVTSTVSGITVGADELNARMPVQREASYVAMLAPATVQGDTAFNGETPGQNVISMSGASVAENSYQVNGLNVTNFRNGLGSSLVPMEFVEEIQVKTGGYAAEFGRSTGGVINMVTKSGSNSLHGSFSAFFEPESLQEQEPDTYARPNESEEREILEANASLGGAIFKDHLFFFGFVRYTDSNVLGITGNTDDDVAPGDIGRGTRNEISDPYYGGKIDWNITSNHRVEATYITDSVNVDVTTYDFDLYDRDLLASTGVGIDDRGGDNYIFKYTGIFTENFLLAAQYGSNDFDRTSSSPGDVNPYAYDSRGGQTVPIGNWVNWSRGSAFDEREAYRLDADLYLGKHSLRAGVDTEANYSFDNTEYSGGIYFRYYDDDESPTGMLARVRHYNTGGGFDVNSDAAYAQDSWAVTPNLTVNLGVRWEKFENFNGLGETFIETDDQWAPRLGFIWDPSGEGRSKVYASYGMYYLPIASNTNVRMAGNESFDQAYYVWDGSMNPDGSPVGWADCGFGVLDTCGNQGSIGDNVAYSIYADGDVPDPREVISTNFDPMSQNELIVGYEKMVGDDWSVGIRGVMRNFNEVIEDYTIDAGLFNAYGLCDPADGGCFEYRLGNPGSDFIGFYDIDGDGELDEVTFSAEEMDYPEAERNYYALEFTFKRRFADNWMLQGSYTWSHLYGNYEGYVRSDNGQDDAGLTTMFDFPGLMENSYGNLPQDRRHNLKMFGAYAWDSGLQVGGNFYYASGRPINSFGVHPGHDGGFAALYDAESFFTQGEAMPRGCCGTTDDIFGIDGMVKYDFQLGNVDMNVRLDVFNLFDQSGVTEVNELGDQDTGFANENYKRPTHYQQPRRVRLGFGLNF